MKVYPFIITKKPEDNIIVQIDEGKQFYGRLHQHREIQLSYIVAGQGKVIVGNNVTTFGPNDFIGIGANLPHLFQNSNNEIEARMISLFFLKDCFGKNFFSSNEMEILQSTFNSLSYGIKFRGGKSLDHLFKSIDKQNKFEAFLSLLKILKLSTSAKKELLNEKGFVHNLSNNQGKRLQAVMDFTLHNFDQVITLEEVAEKAHMGKNSFCRFFKQRTNKTFFQFLSEVRINNACELLSGNPDMPISEIALASGYHSISNFNFQFRELKNMNPKAYRNSLLTKFKSME